MVAAGIDSEPAELTEEQVEAGRRLASAIFGIGKQQAALGHRMSKAGVDRSTVMLLKTLVHHGPSRSSALAAAIHSDPSTVSRQIAAMVRDGLVERMADPEDGRASVVQAWPPEDVDRFLGLLERFVGDHERHLPTMINECAAFAARSEGEK